MNKQIEPNAEEILPFRIDLIQIEVFQILEIGTYTVNIGKSS